MMYGYWKEKLHINHLKESKDFRQLSTTQINNLRLWDLGFFLNRANENKLLPTDEEVDDEREC